MRVATIIGAALLAASTGLYAQAPAPKADSKDGDRAQRREQLKQAHEKASRACEGKKGEEHRNCMATQMCAQAKDPKACEARIAKARDSHAKARKACEGKEGDARRDCMRKEMCAQSKDPAKCEAQAKEWMAKRDAARAACKGREGDALRSCMRDQMKK